MRISLSCSNLHDMNRLYRRDKDKKMIPVGYLCPLCGEIYVQDLDLPICNIMDNGDPESKKVKSDDWGIPIS